MAFCGKCGAQVGDNNSFCTRCGAPIENHYTGAQQTAQPGYSQGGYNTVNEPLSPEQQDIANNKAFAILSYFSWLVLIPIFAAPNSKFARFHANQGLTLAIFEVAWGILMIILTVIIGFATFGLGLVFVSLLGLANIGFLVLAIIGIVNACNGEFKELPIIGSIKFLK